MEDIIVELTEEEFIPLVKLLKITDVIQTGGEIKMLLEEDRIMYNDVVAFQKRKKCYVGDIITVDDQVRIIIK